MVKLKLYWRVLANFGFLLIILTAMAILTLSILSQIEKHFEFSAKDARILSNLEKVRVLVNDIPYAVDEYVSTGSMSARENTLKGWGDFDGAVTTMQRELTDSLMMNDLKQIKDLFVQWTADVGQKRVLLREERRSTKEMDAELHSLTALETSKQYLPIARRLIRDIYRRLSSSQQQRIELATSLSKEVESFIGLVNILFAIFAVVLGFVLTRSITKPVSLLKEGTQNIMAGKFESINLNRSDELGELAADFNKMSTMLGNNYTRLNAYSELVTALNTHASVQDVEMQSLGLVCYHSNASVGGLYLLDTEKNILELVAGYALKQQQNGVKRFGLGEGIPGQCAAEQKTLEINDIPASTGFAIDTGLVEVIPPHVIAVPILFQDKVLGVLVLGSMHPFDELRKDIINNSVPQIGVAITNARNYEATQKLSREIAKKNEELNSKNKELEKAYRVKSDFLSSMSHELRTPLNSIIGFSSVLLGPSGDPLTPDQRMALEKVLKNGKHLLQLINDILDFSKIEAGRMTVNIETDEVANVVANSVMTVEAMIQAKKLTLKQNIASNLPQLKTDVLKVKQILVNLFSNAVKFTEKGEISVTVSQQNNMLAFAVKDSGIGIEKKNFDLVFEEFQQIESSDTRKYKGTGLGLPISRRLARMLGGDLTVDSEFGKGSTFTLTIPPVFPEQQKPKTEPTPTVKERAPLQKQDQSQFTAIVTSGVQILCIDDDPDVIEILRKYLVPEGYSVAGALSGDEGIKIASQIKPALITLDIMMPEKDGWQVLRELKQSSLTKDIPVIIHSIIDNKPLAMSLGAVDVMPKPIESKQLLSLLERTFKSKDQFVLIVDDDEDFSLALKQLLEGDGFKARIANSGEQAMEIMKTSIPAIILLDLIMPGMNGFQVVRKLQENETWRKVPVVILSGKELSNEEREELNSHIREYMRKADFSREAISNIIKRILGTSQQQRN